MEPIQLTEIFNYTNGGIAVATAFITDAVKIALLLDPPKGRCGWFMWTQRKRFFTIMLTALTTSCLLYWLMFSLRTGDGSLRLGQVLGNGVVCAGAAMLGYIVFFKGKLIPESFYGQWKSGVKSGAKMVKKAANKGRLK